MEKTIVELGGAPLLYWWMAFGNTQLTKINMSLLNLEAIALRSLQARLCMLSFVNNAREIIKTDFSSLTETKLRSVVEDQVEKCFQHMIRLLASYEEKKTDSIFVFFSKATMVLKKALTVIREILQRLPGWTEETAHNFVCKKIERAQTLLQALVAASF
jgi:hypothetical protein